jgi:uncharacterized protein YqjF (DUF2071 family)
MRQFWGKLLFMHWPIEAELLRPLIPKRLTIDTYEGKAWIGVVPFTMWGVRPTFTPPFPGLSAFHELNVRTYVHYDGVPGVWFFSLDANNAPAVWAARNFLALPYFNARITLEQQAETIRYSSTRTHKDAPSAGLETTWKIGESLEASAPGSLAFFLTERYCLYAARNDKKLYRLRIFHPVWPLRRASLSSFDSTMVEALTLPTPAGEPLLHYAEKLKVDIWPLVKL